MRRLLLILFASFALSLAADDFIDDIYFTREDALRRELLKKRGELVPRFNAKAREIVFVSDTVGNPHPDTVQIIIRDTPLNSAQP